MREFFKSTGFLRAAFFALVAFVPFGTKKFLFAFDNPFHNYYTSEYNSAFLFASDILLVVFLAAFFFGGRRFLPAGKVFLWIFLGFSAISVLFAGYQALAAYYLLRLLLVVVFAIGTESLLKGGAVKLREIFAVVAASAVFQGVVSFSQFLFQKSVGLRLLGETAFTPLTNNVARIRVGDFEFVRGYGTTPHANILAAFLVLGMVFLCYIFLTSIKGKGTALIFCGAGIFVSIVGLVLTFSRSGWIGAFAGLVAAIAWGLLNPEYRRRGLGLLAVISLSVVFTVSVTSWSVFSRARLSAQEEPVADRLTYDYIGLDIISNVPQGVGIGNQMFYSYDRNIFDDYGLKYAGQWQPIHNIYLLVGSEVGILGLVAIAIFIVSLIVKIWEPRSAEKSFVLIALFSALLLGLVDHYFWDLESGRLMFWLILGIMMGLSPHSSMDRAQASEA